MTTVTALRVPARRLDRERTETALHAARALLIDQAPAARTATAYGMNPDELAELLARLANDIAAVSVRT